MSATSCFTDVVIIVFCFVFLFVGSVSEQKMFVLITQSSDNPPPCPRQERVNQSNSAYLNWVWAEMSLAQFRPSLFLYYSQISMNDPAHKQKLVNVDKYQFILHPQ